MINITMPSAIASRKRLLLPLVVVIFLMTTVGATAVYQGLQNNGLSQEATQQKKSDKQDAITKTSNGIAGKTDTNTSSSGKTDQKAQTSQPTSTGSSSKKKTTTGTTTTGGQSTTSGGTSGSGSSGSGGTTTPPPYVPRPLVVANFETGNFNQWDICQIATYNNPCSGYNGSHYALTLSNTIKRQGNWAARFEIRDGDMPFCCGERSELQGGTSLTNSEGQDRWYQWSTYFSAGFPEQGWSLVAQWHADADGSPPLAFPSSDEGLSSGNFGLIERKYSSPTQLLSNNLIWQASRNPGTWHDIKIHVKWSTSDAVGFIELWHNGARQTFSGMCNGQTRCMARTMTPGGGNVYFKQGYYRDPAHTTTGVVYHDGFSMAATEADLDPL